MQNLERVVVRMTCNRFHMRYTFIIDVYLKEKINKIGTEIVPCFPEQERCGDRRRDFGGWGGRNCPIRAAVVQDPRSPPVAKKRDECTRGQFGVTPAACLGHPPLVGHPPSCLKTWYRWRFPTMRATTTDPETGQVIHECDEPLGQHTGHGSGTLKKRV